MGKNLNKISSENLSSTHETCYEKKIKKKKNVALGLMPLYLFFAATNLKDSK